MARPRKKTTDEAEATTGAGAREAEAPEAEAPEAEAPEAEAPEVEEPAAAAEPGEAAAEEAEAEPIVDEPAAEGEAPEEAPRAGAGPAAEAAVEPPTPQKKRKRLPRALRHTHSKPTRERSAKRKPIVRTAKAESEPGRRQERRGVVVSDKGDKSIVVRVETIRAHAKYKKVVRRSARLHAHDEENSAGIGDVVRIVETRPLSKTKRWRLAEIVEKAK
jgi:small subunit ribosomal protein S17